MTLDIHSNSDSYIRDGWNIYNEGGDMCGFYHDGAPHLLRDGIIYNWDGVIRGSIENGKVVWIERHLELRHFDGAYYERRDLEIYDEKGALCGFYHNFTPYIFDGYYVVNWEGERRGFIVGGTVMWSDNIDEVKRYVENVAVSTMLSQICEVNGKDYILRGNFIYSTKEAILGTVDHEGYVTWGRWTNQYKRLNRERHYKRDKAAGRIGRWWRKLNVELCEVDGKDYNLRNGKYIFDMVNGMLCEVDGKDYNLRNGKYICDMENGMILATVDDEGDVFWNSDKR